MNSVGKKKRKYLDELAEILASDSAESEDRYIAITVDGKMYEAEDVDGEAKYLKTDLRSGREFTVSAAQFNMYARIGFHHVVGMDVTKSQFQDIVMRLRGLDDVSRVNFAVDNSLTPPE